MIELLLLVIGFALWYFYYGLECFINGGSLGRNPYTMHFPLLWEEFQWLLPGGWEKKLKICDGDENLAKSLPGWLHFIGTHICIPFAPLIFWIVK